VTSPAGIVPAYDDPPHEAPTGVLRDRAASAAVILMLAWWATYLLWGTGGREPHVLSVSCGLLLVSTLLVQPWRVLGPRTMLLGCSIGVAAFLVVLTAPTGWAGAHEAASYTHAGLLGVVVLAWARTAPRRLVLHVTVIAAAGLQFSQGWLAWWGNGDQTELFQGTFYWHNQAGIFLAAGALLAFGAVTAGRAPLAPLGWAIGPMAAAGVVFSTSRGSQLGLALGTVLLLGIAIAARMRAGAVRLLGAAAASWLVAYVLSGPPFFAERLAATAGTEERAGSFVSNGVQRFEDWRRAYAIFEHWPISGAGFNSFDGATELVTTKRDGVTTAFAHNGFLQLLADGGLVLAVPVLGVLALVLVRSVRSLPLALRSSQVAQLTGFVTLLVLLLHSGMDFDWTYPGLLSLTALVAVLGLPLAEDRSWRPRLQGALLGSLAAVLLTVSAVGAWQGGLDLNAPVSAEGTALVGD
jgi:O-antigen ligase